MLSPMGRISSGSEAGTPHTHPTHSASVMAARLVQPDAAKPRRPGLVGESRAAASRTDVLTQELLHALHALLVGHFGERILDRIDGVVVGEIELSRLIGILAL